MYKHIRLQYKCTNTQGYNTNVQTHKITIQMYKHIRLQYKCTNT